MSQLFDNELFIINKIRALEHKNNVEIMDIDIIKNETDNTKNILLEVYDLHTRFIKELEYQFETNIFNIFGTNKWTSQIFLGRDAPIMRLLD